MPPRATRLQEMLSKLGEMDVQRKCNLILNANMSDILSTVCSQAIQRYIYANEKKDR